MRTFVQILRDAGFNVEPHLLPGGERWMVAGFGEKWPVLQRGWR